MQTDCKKQKSFSCTRDGPIITRQGRGGFTLIELILYISIAGVVLVVLTTLFATLSQSRIKNQTVLEVERQGAQAMQRITQEVRSSESINTPSAGSSDNELSLKQPDAGQNPTVFSVTNGTLKMAEGGGPAKDLTNTRISVSDFTVSNLSQADTPGVVRVEFTLEHVNSSGRNAYDFSDTFYTSASLRP